MNASAAFPRWTPPLGVDDLAALLAKVQQWTPFDGDALLDDVGAVLDEVVPPEEDFDVLAQRLRGHLMRLVDIAVAAGVADKDLEAERLIRQARTVHAGDVPGDHRRAVGHLRRMAWSLNELFERLSAIKYVKEAA
ncbi:DUF6415 family natural product biosynthesis protein [Streptomyces thermoalcalitolerans]|uniref:DUF6415 family natural product biosynthesis protein n=1 Tax=Streptomyces thermoalcalitolerans TaxID=65605 RepID=UPI0031E42A0E